jgi:rhamnosyltransferase
VKRDIVVSFANLGNPLGISIYQNGPVVDAVYGRQPLSFISDVNAAYRRDILLGPVPFPRVDYAEDQAIARELLDAGYAIAYTPFAEVLHSNDLNLANFRDRIVDEALGLHEALGVEPPHERVWGRGLIKASARGMVFAWRDTSLTPRARLSGALSAPAFEVRRRQAWRYSRSAGAS